MFNKSLDEGIVLDPYYFMLKLDDKIKEKYQHDPLVITEKSIRNQMLNEENFNEAIKYYINHFLGWNFRVSVNRNQTLKNELKELNKKVIYRGIRKYAGPGFKVHGIDKEVYHGLQQYYLPTNKKSLLIKK